jgi:hypothetical protein
MRRGRWRKEERMKEKGKNSSWGRKKKVGEERPKQIDIRTEWKRGDI